MGLPRRPAPGSSGMRTRAERLAERVDALPRSPFVAAVVLSIALLAAALADAAEPGPPVGETGTIAESNAGAIADAEVEAVEIEIVEYGFGIIELHGQERLTVGAVVRNPHPTAVAHLVFEVAEARGDDSFELFRANYVPPDSEVLIGRILAGTVASAPDAPVLTVMSASFDPPFESPPPDYLPERFAVLGIEPLLSPQGHRIVFRIESELDHEETSRPDVVFRDSGGAIVGGVGGNDHAAYGADHEESIQVPPGDSIHHFNLRSEEIPAGADLLKTEIGPGAVIPGG